MKRFLAQDLETLDHSKSFSNYNSKKILGKTNGPSTSLLSTKQERSGQSKRD